MRRKDRGSRPPVNNSNNASVIDLSNPGRFAHFPVRLRIVSPTSPFAPIRFALGSFRPLSRSPLSRFAHFHVRPRVVSPPYKILFLLLLFRPQKCYKALIFLLIGDFTLYSQYFASVYCMSFCKTEKCILYCSNFKYVLFLSSTLDPWTFQILRYIWHFHVLVS